MNATYDAMYGHPGYFDVVELPMPAALALAAVTEELDRVDAGRQYWRDEYDAMESRYHEATRQLHAMTPRCTWRCYMTAEREADAVSALAAMEVARDYCLANRDLLLDCYVAMLPDYIATLTERDMLDAIAVDATIAADEAREDVDFWRGAWDSLHTEYDRLWDVCRSAQEEAMTLKAERASLYAQLDSLPITPIWRWRLQDELEQKTAKPQ